MRRDPEPRLNDDSARDRLTIDAEAGPVAETRLYLALARLGAAWHTHLERSPRRISLSNDANAIARSLRDAEARPRDDDGVWDAARVAVADYVRELRASNVTPQASLVLVKAAARDATSGSLDGLEVRALMEDVVRWSVDAYYDCG